MAGWLNASTDTVLAVLERSVEKNADVVFLDFEGDVYTYAEIWHRAAVLAGGLRDLKVANGERVVSMLDNGPDAVAMWFASNFVGAIHVAINTALRGDFLRHVVADSQARVVVAEHDLIDRFTTVRTDLPAVDHYFYRGEPDPAVIDDLKACPLDMLRSSNPTSPLAAQPGDLTCLVYTGGTTGPSKGCMISHNYPVNAGRMYLDITGRTADEVNWNCLPLYHMNIVNTSLMPSLMLGGTLSVPRKFSLSGFWGEIERSGARVVNLLGSMIALIAGMPDNDQMMRCKNQIRAVVGAPFPPELARVWTERFGIRLAGASTYGLTECVPVTSLRPDQVPRPGSSGTRNEFFDVRIFDDDDRELPPGEAGEIVARPNAAHVMFEGYWRRPDDTVKAWRNGWFHTGDIGMFDDDGYFFFLDRKKDYLRRRGENVSSSEMEEAFLKHSDIVDVAVHAVPSELTEDDLKVTAVLKAGSALDEPALFAWAVDRVPYFALPRYIEFREELPTTPLGKVLKYQLRDQGCTPSTWDRDESDVEFTKR